MKNNKLTLKALKQELELLKSSKAKNKVSTPMTESHKSSVAHDIKNSYIQNLHMKSSMFMLWLITIILSYAHKIPFIGRIITLLSMYYGRTTIWKILIKLRKLFILFNSVIGVYLVFKTTGFSFDNILAGFAGMGHTYLEILINFTKRLFNWIFDLFDYKVVPNVPGGSTGNKTLWSNKLWGFSQPTNSSSILPNFSLRELYAKNPTLNININSTPWYKDFSTLIWAGGILGGLGLMVIVYKFIQDPTFIHNIFSKGDGPITNVTVPSPKGSGSGIALEDVGSKGKGVIKSITFILSGIKSGIKKVNPYNWFLTISDFEENHRQFMINQNSINYDSRFYPFTEVNPYFSWFDRMRISWLGENIHEKAGRRALKSQILDEIMAFGKNKGSPIASTSGSLTPTIGLGIDIPSGSTFLDECRVFNKLGSLPNTPTVSPGLTPMPLPDLSHLPQLPNPFNTIDYPLKVLYRS